MGLQYTGAIIKLSRLTGIALAAAGTLYGWFWPQLSNVCNSAPVAGETVWVNVDITEGEHPPDAAAVTLFYSTDNQITWQSEQMTLVGGTGYDSTYEAGFSVPGSGVVCYYVRASNGTNYGTEAPFNRADSWPVPDCFLADVALEGTGDTFNNPRGDYLDLTSYALGYSEGWLYSRMTNNSNSWPIKAGPVGPWFAYSAGFANNDALSDTWGYSMSYANILGIYRTGLYELNKYTESFERIGNVDAVTSGNRLVMRCRISDFAVRPRWGSWPIKAGCFATVRAETRSGNASLQSVRHDSTCPALYYVDHSPSFVVGRNRAPVLSESRVLPRTGDTSTAFQLSTYYTDPDSNLPTRRTLFVDGDTLVLSASVHSYWRGARFQTQVAGFAAGWHRFHFEFSDGMAGAVTPEDSFLVATSVLAEGPPEVQWDVTAAPNPFVDRVRLAFPLPARAVEILDAAGRRVRSFNAPGADGSVSWDGRDETGRVLPAGVFFLREGGGPLRRLLVKLAGH